MAVCAEIFDMPIKPPRPNMMSLSGDDFSTPTSDAYKIVCPDGFAPSLVAALPTLSVLSMLSIYLVIKLRIYRFHRTTPNRSLTQVGIGCFGISFVCDVIVPCSISHRICRRNQSNSSRFVAPSKMRGLHSYSGLSRTRLFLSFGTIISISFSIAVHANRGARIDQEPSVRPRFLTSLPSLEGSPKSARYDMPIDRAVALELFCRCSISLRAVANFLSRWTGARSPFRGMSVLLLVGWPLA